MYTFTTYLVFFAIIYVSFIPKIEAATKDFTYHRPSDWYLDHAACGEQLANERQSPINLDYFQSEFSSLSPLHFNYIASNKAFNVTYKGDGSGVEIVNPGEFMVSGANLASDYILQQFHMHTPSEHHKSNEETVMELHLVHSNSNISDGWVSHPKGIVVFGIMFKEGAENIFMKDFLAKIENLNISATNETSGNSTKYHLAFPHMSGLFPDDASTTFYTYPGSLTTPPCYESVTWFVADTYQTISTEQLSAIERLHASSNNNRPIQPPNNRMIRRSFDDNRTASPTSSPTSTGNNAPSVSSAFSVTANSVSVCFLLITYWMFE